MKRLIHHLILALLLALPVLAQQSAPTPEGEEAPERVQYTLILPEEKNPEIVKPEENSPFEVTAGEAEMDADSEENRVRDILLRMPAVGGGSGANGMRVMLGSMRLQAGQEVPPVLPDQQVLLKVKSVTPTAIELIWVEKKPTGLPPKPFVINVDVSPKVRYRMPASTGGQGGGDLGTMKRADVSAFTPRAVPEPEPPRKTLAIKAVPVEDKSDAPAEPSPEPPRKALLVKTAPVEDKPASPAKPAPEPPRSKALAAKATPVEDKPASSAEQPRKALALKTTPVEDKPASSAEPATSSPANVPEASVLRMLFGNHAIQPKK